MVDVNVEIFYDGKTYKCNHQLKLSAIPDINYNYATPISENEFKLIDNVLHSLLENLCDNEKLFNMKIHRTFNKKPFILEYNLCQVLGISVRPMANYSKQYIYKIGCCGEQKVIDEKGNYVMTRKGG